MEKVLLVDDDSIFLRIIEHEMRKYEGQFEVSLAKNGVEAVEALKKEDVSVVVTDLMMPEMDGLELLAHVTRNYPRIP
ncbi:MAG: response regulator, partial [Desulfobacterales bacterium]|nr:response regulator [Desulfobacterales bacterium]